MIGDCSSPETCGICHNCQKPGHRTEDCPEKKLKCTGCILTERLARCFGWSEEVNCPPWSWLEDQIRDRDKILSDSEQKKSVDRWALGIPHNHRSMALFQSIAKIDFEEFGDSFGFKSGGDGDNGETLMYILDVHFERNP